MFLLIVCAVESALRIIEVCAWLTFAQKSMAPKTKIFMIRWYLLVKKRTGGKKQLWSNLGLSFCLSKINCLNDNIKKPKANCYKITCVLNVARHNEACKLISKKGISAICLFTDCSFFDEAIKSLQECNLLLIVINIALFILFLPGFFL